MNHFLSRGKVLALCCFGLISLALFAALGVLAEERGVKVNPLPQANPAGTQWLVLIGIDEYANPHALSRLNSCKADMKALGELLVSRFNYKPENVVELYDAKATRKGIERTIYDLLKKVGPNDSVAIGYAGHGYYDKDTRLGWWFPQDAESPADGIPNSTIRDWCAAFKAKKVLVIADSCFSGSLLSREGFTEDATLKSRELLAAGGLHPVADAGSPDGLHSIFNHYLRWSLTRLADQGKPFVTNDLYVSLYTPVKVNSSQEPQKGIMEGTFHEGGQFLFYPSGGSTPVQAVVSAPTALPSSGGLDLDDILKAEEEQKKAALAEKKAKDSWAEWQSARSGEFAKVKGLDGSESLTPDQKAVAWDRVLAAISQDNPYSTEDDSMRSYGRSRIDYWKGEGARQAREADERKKAPKPVEVAMGTHGGMATNSIGMKFVYCPPGTFNETAHKVTLTRFFYMQTTEVTQGQWQKVMGSNPSYFKNCADCPVEQVSWNDCQEFIQRLNSLDPGKGYRLPTEAEWEYACRAGSDTPYYWGSESGIGSHAWYDGNSGNKTHPVAQKTPNAWGLYDMSGNVWEWCSDWYGSNFYANSPNNDPVGPDTGSFRVLRGGSWNLNAGHCRSAFRNWSNPDYRFYHLGFRVVFSRIP